MKVLALWIRGYCSGEERLAGGLAASLLTGREPLLQAQVSPRGGLLLCSSAACSE